MVRIRVTQAKSSIKRPRTQKLTLEALGLERAGFTAGYEAIPSIPGTINKIKYLTSVEGVK